MTAWKGWGITSFERRMGEIENHSRGDEKVLAWKNNHIRMYMSVCVVSSAITEGLGDITLY